MKAKNKKKKYRTGKLPFLTNVIAHTINLAIVGGGRACKYFLELLYDERFPFLDINIVGVCDINPEAEGFVLAKKLGIYTTNNFEDLFKIKELDSIIELTGSQEVLLEIIRLRPKGVGVLEHNIGRLLRNLFKIDQRLQLTEHQLIIEKMFSDFLIQQSTAAIMILNTDFTIVETNEAYLKMVNRSKEEVVGAPCYKISYGLNAPCSSCRPEMKCPMVETLRTGISSYVLHEYPGSGDRPSFYNIVTYPLRNEVGEIFRIIEVFRDITEEFSHRWDKRVKELKSDLQKLIQEDRMISLGKLAASCAHEINNPIQGLLTFSHLMQEILDEGDPGAADLEQFKEHLAFMSKELERCGQIVSGLLSFSHEYSLEYKNLEYKEIDFNEILEAVLTLTRHKMKLQNIQLTIKLSPKPLWAKGDANQLQQCFLNLIFNAISAMPKGGELYILSKLDDDKKNACIEIRDTGYGIPEETLDHIYDPFFTTKEAGEATGLGLSIVYGVTKNHGGNIKVDTRVGEGTSFILNFPTH
jgi:two-component system, NtrC family, sensor kinase